VFVTCLAPASAAFAQSFERGWVDVNIGVAVAAEKTFTTNSTDAFFLESATFETTYHQPTGASVDFGGGFMFTPRIGAGISFTGTAHEGPADLRIVVPHPLFTSTASDSDKTKDKLQRTEGGVNIQVMAVVSQSDRLRVRVFGGPSYFRVKQDIVDTIHYDYAFLFSSPAIAADITGEDLREVEGKAWGFHAGGDVSWFFTRVVGLGGFARFSRANVEFDDAFDDAGAIEVKAGGFQTGGGLRLKF
jgi:hypothetical protein